LPLEEILPEAEMDGLRRSEKLVFHTVGNTGGIKNPHMQMLVAGCMQEQFSTPRVQDRPAFLYHLGDVVYFYGSAENYYSQFYLPYAHYPAPIFAIPGNHDGDVDPDHSAPSLHGFVRNFCAATVHHNPEAVDSPRVAMTQPNVYWTLDSPLATFIGLYTNVPEGGMLDETQNAWLITELSKAPPDRALIVAMHHPIYSLSLRGPMSSEYLAGVMERGAKASGRYPDIVLASHVLNYQRFTRTLSDRQIPYIVVGAGGYPRLRSMQRQAHRQAIKTPFLMPGQPGVSLDSYCDDRHGFMRVTVTRKTLTGYYFSVTANSGTATAKQIDSFSLDLLQHRVTQPD
jgi:predicted MPP superfamily phosphohydrolase